MLTKTYLFQSRSSAAVYFLSHIAAVGGEVIGLESKGGEIDESATRRCLRETPRQISGEARMATRAMIAAM